MLLGDSRLRDLVIQQIEWEPAISSKDISVTVKDGVVSLNGFTHSYLEKKAAERAAKSVYGVNAIANDIEVRPATERTDPEIARDIEKALEMHSFVPSGQIKVTVRNASVTLEGSVEWEYQRRSAASAALAVSGVRNLNNNIQLTPHVSPHQVKQQIEAALHRAAELDARRIIVSASDSKVELRGYVRSWLEKEEAERAAWSAPGVKSVTDHLVVAP